MQELNVTNPNVGQMCFYCYFVLNSNANGCLVSYKHIETNVINNVTILRTFNETLVTDCVENVTNGYYNILVFDKEDESELLSNNPAVHITSVLINGLSIDHTRMLSSTPVLQSTESSAPTKKTEIG